MRGEEVAGTRRVNGVTHWMPLSAPPERREDG